MTDYVKATNFAAKDSLPSGDANKKIRGTEINDELVSIQTAIATKLDKASPVMTGTPLAPTPSISANNTQITTTEWVRNLINLIEPLGTIKAWAGAIGSIPTGWAICNGNNGTVNLTDRFIAGAGGGAFGQNTTGGYNVGSLRLPNEGTTFSSGSHSHGGSTGFTALTEGMLPAHTHGSSNGGSFYTNTGGVNVATGPGYSISFTATTASTGSGQGHNHTIVGDGSHFHSFDGTVASSPVPGFFALVFIQKINLL